MEKEWHKRLVPDKVNDHSSAGRFDHDKKIKQ